MVLCRRDTAIADVAGWKMKLFEFEAKNILSRYGIPVPRGDVAATPAEAAEIADKVGKPVAVKSQILVSGRGKAGGIVFADNAREVEKAASTLLGSSIKGCRVERLLVEEKLDMAGQFYASVAIDRQARTYVVLASTSGGVDIEEVAQTSPEQILRHRVDIIAGFSKQDATAMLSRFDMSKEDVVRFASILDILYRAALDCDAELVEINPLVRTASGEFVAADARIIVDDNALFRHPEFGERGIETADATPLEVEARRQRLAYVDLDGDVGIIGNGAGLVMATLDLVHLYGGRPANFLDIGGGGNVDITKRGLLLVMSKPEVKAVLVNILGGITRCDIVAQAIIETLTESAMKKPVAVRMMGTNEEEGQRILGQAGISSYPNMEKAIEEVLKLIGRP
ncbi:ADP-forming succinate--CoA ligase subunit beta [Chloroflexota bacterium]